MTVRGARTHMAQRTRQVRVTIDDESRGLILALVANLIGGYDRIPEMGMNKLKPDMIPDTKGKDPLLDAARVALKLMYDLAEDKLPPTEENLMPGMKKVFGEDAQAHLDALFNERGAQSNPAEMVALYSFYLSEWIGYQAMQSAVRTMQEILDDSEGNNADLHAQMADALLQVAPARRLIEINEYPEDVRLWRRDLLKDKEKAKEKGAVGPETPWPMLNSKTGALRKGELDLWSAKTGFGKSTVAFLLAKHAAWNKEQGYNVILLAFEQYQRSIIERHAASVLNVTTRDLHEFGFRSADDKNAKYFDPEAPYWMKRLDEFEGEVARLNDERGRLAIVPAAGWGPYDIETEVAKWAAISQADGRELYVIYDYYDLINARGLQFYGSSQTAALEAITDFLRDAIGQQYGVYTTAFAQDSVNTNYIIRQMPYNGQRIYQRAQRYVRIERAPADTTQFVMNSQGTEPAVDALGLS